MSTWQAREERLVERLDAGPARRMHALFDSPGPAPVDGDDLPVLWHWLYFLPTAAQGELGPDGHPLTGGFLPPAPYPRRMFAASTITVERPLRVGDTAVRGARATAPELKQGRSGPLGFVSVALEYHGEPDGRVVENQTVVYRPEGQSPVERHSEAVPAGAWRFDLEADERLLFRFSALTYNAHRIHYDLRYAQQVEGYPGLVVHGPLLAMGLAEVVRRSAADQRIARLSFRAERPAFAPTALSFTGTPSATGATVDLVASDRDGPLMRAEADLAPAG
jgi:3-methylfumaryl-CoA hydratase